MNDEIKAIEVYATRISNDLYTLQALAKKYPEWFNREEVYEMERKLQVIKAHVDDYHHQQEALAQYTTDKDT